MTHESTYIMNMLEKIQLKLEHLSKSERKVADIILASPERAIHSSIAALAVEANVSEPTVNRFCRSMDTAAFLILNCIWRKVWQMAPLMLIAMWMRMTA